MKEAEASTAGGHEPAKNGTTNGESSWRDWPTENATARSYGLFTSQLRRIVKKHALAPLKAPDLTLRYSPHLVSQLEQILRKDGVPTDDAVDDEDDDTPRIRTSGKKASESELVAALRLSNEHTRESFKITQSAQKELFALLKDANKDLAEECRMLREGHRTATEAREAALDQRAERDMLIEKSRKSDARMDAVMATAGQGIQMAIAQIVETWQDWKKPKYVKGAELLTKLATRIAETLDLTPEEKAELIKACGANEEPKEEPAAPAASSGSSSDAPPSSAAAGDPSSSCSNDGAASSGAGTDGTAATAGTAAVGGTAPETKRASRRSPSDTGRKKGR